MTNWLKPTVTPSDVVYVLSGGPPVGAKPDAARRGIAVHRQIMERIQTGQAPPGLQAVGICGTGGNSSQVQREIAPGLVLRARPDYKEGDKLVEIKPRLSQRHIVQIGLTRMAAGGAGVNAIYTYENDQVAVVEGLDQVEPELIRMAESARTVLDNQQRLADHPSWRGTARDAVNAQSFASGENIRRDLGTVMKKVKVTIGK